MVVSLDADSPRVDWQVNVDNRSRDHRVRLLFPTGVDSIAVVRAETAFGVAERPARREVPAEVRVEMPMSSGPTGSFTEVGSDSAGAIIFGDGLVEYEAVADAHGRTSQLALTLLRAVGDLSRDDLVTRPSGHAGPGLATPGAQCLGSHAFRVGFEPRGPKPTGHALFARAASFIAPPHVVPVIGSDPVLSTTGRFVGIDARSGGVVLSACHRAEDGQGLLLRVFNADLTPARVKLATTRPLVSASRVDFLERPLEALPADAEGASLDVGPYRIETVRLDT